MCMYVWGALGVQQSNLHAQLRNKRVSHTKKSFSNKKFNLISIFKKFSKRYSFFMFVVVVLKYNNK